VAVRTTIEGTLGPPAADREAAGGAISQVFRDYNRVLVRWLAIQLGDYQDACEIAQEAYTRVLTHERSRTIGYLRAYLFKVAANLAIDRLRSRAVAGRLEGMDLLEGLGSDASGAEPLDTVERAADAAQEAARFWETLRELPPSYRQTLVLSRLQDLSCEQIASMMGITPRSVRRYIAHALTYCRLRMIGYSSEAAQAVIAE